ncbi:Trm112 family protein [Dactylosporangium sp. CA-139066]|uniref:Trm112 family protein n=1 Tax=Dactylosporangium sp. CA-139066 TaxID=3239930 RepID=UPI003D908B02
MSVDPALLSILRCPDEHHAELTFDAEAQTLTCTECGRIFEIRDGIPVLLLDEAVSSEAAPGTSSDTADEEGEQ